MTTPDSVTISRPASRSLTRGDRYRILIAVFLGWMFAGMEMALMVPTARPAIQDFLAAGQLTGSTVADQLVLAEPLADKWFSWFLVAFLLGAACGGIVFGWLGDRAGRVRAMG